MPTEKPKKQLNKTDILKAFGDRVLMEQQEKVEREYLDLDPDLTKQALVPADIADQFESIESKDCVVGDTEMENSPLGKPLFIKLLKSEPNPVSLVINKAMWRADGLQEESDYESEFIITIMKGDLTGKNDREVIDAQKERGDEIGSFRLSLSDNAFEMMHRLVREDYRGPQNKTGERISNISLGVCEQIVKSFAASKQKERKLQIYSGQLDVMLWLYNNGYEFRNKRSKDRFQDICDSDEKLRIIDGLYVYESDKIPPRDQIYKHRHDAYQVSFEKSFTPEGAQQSKKDLIGDTRNRLDVLN